MAVLTDTAREEVWGAFMRDPRTGPLGVITKAQLRAAVDAADDWSNANAASFNSALPLPARTVLTTAQKALLHTHVTAQRYLKGV